MPLVRRRAAGAADTAEAPEGSAGPAAQPPTPKDDPPADAGDANDAKLSDALHGARQQWAKARALPLGLGSGAVGALTFLACGTRLWSLHLPATPVYDETHVGRFLNWYVDRAYFFDVHGPLAKLLMLWTSQALGFEGRASCPYESSEPYAAECTLAPQRLVPALCGAAMVPLTFATCCAMRLHPYAATLAAWLVLVDTLWIGLSRLHLNDMVQMLFIALTHYLALSACRAPNPGEPDRPLARQALSLGATGLALGCALQCKYAMALTTLAWLGLQNLVTLAQYARQRRGARTLLGQAAQRGLLLLGIPFAVHLGLLRLHLSLLPNTGNGDGYMSAGFQATLAGNAHATSGRSGPPLSFLQLAWEHATAQLAYNRNMAILFPHGSHPFDSAWHTWPLARRGIYFNLVTDWGALAADLGRAHSYGFFLHPNPLVTLLSTALTALAAAALVARGLSLLRPWRFAGRAAAAARLGTEFRPGGSGSLVLAYLLHWLPYATQDRQTFLIYYLPAYYFAILATARAWHAVGCSYLPPRLAAAATLALATAAARVSYTISPIAYGSAVTLPEWTAALRLAATECWGGASCFAGGGA